MATKKIVLNICVTCQNCRTCYMKTVATIPGITSLALDGEKSTLTVVGNVDPVLIVEKLKKVKKPVSILTVGPPDKKEEPKKEEPKKEPCKPLPPCCDGCKKVNPLVLIYDDHYPSNCVIF